MTTLVIVLGVLGLSFCGVAGSSSLVAAWRGAAALRRALFAKRTRVIDLDDDGRIVELSGMISFAEKGVVVVSPSGKRCAAAQVTIRSGVSKPENGTPHTFSRGASNVLLTDETGSVMLDLENVEIIAPTYECQMSPRQLVDASTWLAHMPEDVSHYSLLVAESVIEDGALVKVCGRVTRLADDVQLTPDGGGYRDAIPKVDARYRIVGSLDDRLLIAQGGRGKVLLRAGWPAFALVVFACMFLTHASVMVFLLLA